MNEKERKIAVIGGDLRQLFIAEILSERGYAVSVFGLDVEKNITSKCISVSDTLSEAVEGAVLMILPVPLSRDGISINAPLCERKVALSEIFSVANKVKYIAAGLPDEMSARLLSENSTLIDYAARDEFALKNAYATVEGALAVAFKETSVTLRGSICTVCGYGRIGKVLVGTLISLGASVKVFARKKLDRVSAELEGASSYDICEMKKEIYDADIVFNTVPSVIMDKDVLKMLNKNATVIELASFPGGTDRSAAEALGVKLINAQSLPGKFSPCSAAETIVESIFSALYEMEVKI